MFYDLFCPADDVHCRQIAWGVCGSRHVYPAIFDSLTSALSLAVQLRNFDTLLICHKSFSPDLQEHSQSRD